MTPQEFIAKWQHASAKERSAAQEHFIDVCRLIDHPTPMEADPAGERFTFEAGAVKQRGGQGWADVWKRGCFAWEYKVHHADLGKAYDQLLQYREALQNPPLLVVSDMADIVIHTNFTNTVKQVYTLTLADLADPAKLAAIAQAARELVEKRDRWLNPEGLPAAELKKRTLTALYNQRPTWLELAHQKLDAAVLAAYGWPVDLGDEEILARLLALNLERAGA